MLNAILFDLDNTLLNRTTSLQRFIQTQHQRLNQSLGHIPLDLYIKRFSELDANGMVWKDRVYQTLISEFQIQDLSWEQLLEDYVTQFHTSVVLNEGVILALKQFKKEGLALGLITNGHYELQFSCIQTLGLTPYFSSILISETEGIKKPDPDIFHRGTSQLRVKNASAVFIGDHPISDIDGAQRAGLKAIWKKNTVWAEACPQADGQFDRFDELNSIVRTLF